MAGTAGGETETVRLLPFRLTGSLYCVEIDRIASALPVDGSAPLERAADPMRAGTVTVSGQSVRVVDLARIMTPAGSIERTEEPLLLVFEADGPTVGWLVDEVGEARPVSLEQVDPSPPGSRFIKGRIETSSNELLWLDEERINDD